MGTEQKTVEIIHNLFLRNITKTTTISEKELNVLKAQYEELALKTPEKLKQKVFDQIRIAPLLWMMIQSKNCTEEHEFKVYQTLSEVNGLIKELGDVFNS